MDLDVGNKEEKKSLSSEVFHSRKAQKSTNKGIEKYDDRIWIHIGDPPVGVSVRVFP